MKIQVRVPASTANLGTGVDCLGIALSKYLTVVFESCNELEIIFKRGFEHDIPLEKNLVLSGARRIFELVGKTFPEMRITMETDIPASRGLGSSACALVAGVFGANAWLGNPLGVDELIEAATEIEGHPDNIVPCAVGGFTVAMGVNGKVFYHRIPLDSHLKFVAAIPDYELSTKLARSVVPKEFPLSAVISQVQRACFLVAGLTSGELKNMDIASDDIVFTPARKALIPGYERVTESALHSGALCSMISGAGPAIIALAFDNTSEIALAMERGFATADINSCAHILDADNSGAVVAVL
ncbi:MAG: homoserine kinase [Oscillospiraceae bacterium]